MGENKTTDFVSNCIALAKEMLRLPVQHVWLDYDKKADVLHMSFRKPQRANETVELEDDILIRKDGKEIVGLTMLNASHKQVKDTNMTPPEVPSISG